MSLHAQWCSDWACPYPFRVFHIASEADSALGQYCVELALFGLAVEFTWVYDENTPLRAKLAGMMADETWLDTAMVSMTHTEYRALLADAELWRESQKPDETDGAGA